LFNKTESVKQIYNPISSHVRVYWKSACLFLQVVLYPFVVHNAYQDVSAEIECICNTDRFVL